MKFYILLGFYQEFKSVIELFATGFKIHRIIGLEFVGGCLKKMVHKYFLYDLMKIHIRQLF